ncbi:MAG TPA: tail fiber domain-containing protein [Thermoanaerobaculia bacterium]
MVVLQLLGVGAAGAQVMVPNLIYTSVVPCRIIDTRNSIAGKLQPNVVQTFNIVGNNTGTYFTNQGGPSGGCAVPGFAVLQGEAPIRRSAAAGAVPDATIQGPPQVQAVVINLTVVNPAGNGFLNAWPTDHSEPATSLIDFFTGVTLANQVVLAMRQDTQGADISVLSAGSHSTTDLVGDVVGYFSSGSVIPGSPSTGHENLFLGPGAGSLTFTGNGNVGLGAGALQTVGGGSSNTAVGDGAMLYSLEDNGIAIGASALPNQLGGGLNNIAIGEAAGQNLAANESYDILIGNYGVSGDNNVIRIGCGVGACSHPYTAAFISGINGATTASGIPVYVNSNDQLGTLTSSLRFKQDVEDMGTATEGLMQLRPVTFRYKPAYDDGSRLLEYGLIAEEVAKVYPGLVQLDRDGKPLAVRSQFIDAMMLNEVQRQHRTIASQQERIDRQQAQIDDLQHQVRALLWQRQPGEGNSQ